MGNFQRIQFGDNADGSQDTVEVVGGTKLTSQEQLIRLMRTNEYKTSQAYRDKVAELIQNSPEIFAEEGNGYEYGDGTAEREAFFDMRRQVTSDPRYKTSAAYRLAVQNWIKDNLEYVDAFTPETRMLGPKGQNRVIIESEDTPPFLPEDGEGEEGKISHEGFSGLTI